MMFSRVPLPWLNLTHDKLRLAARLLGIAFAVFLLFVELGFWNALLEAPVQLIRQLGGELIVVSQAHYTLAVKEPFPRLCLAPARAAPGVQDVFPVYLEHADAFWKDTDAPKGKRQASQPIRVIAFNPDQPVLKNAAVHKYRDALKVPFNVLLDRESKEQSYGEIKKGIDRELAGRTVHVVGLFELGRDFTNDGNVITSAETYARIFGGGLPVEGVLEWADLGVVRTARGANLQAVSNALRQILPADVRVFTKEKFIEREQAYWKKTTPMGFIFSLGLGVGFIVGAVICYQIISTDVAEHLPQYATLKAMGYRDAFLSGVVLREALWLAVLGFVPGLGLSWPLYRWLGWQTGLPLQMTTSCILFVLFLTLAMCMASGLLALRKLQTADPAEVFA